MRLINQIFISLLPPFNPLASCSISFGVSFYVLFLVFTDSFALAFITTKLLKGRWNKNLVAIQALSVSAYFVGILILLKHVDGVMARHAQRNQIFHAVILADTCRDFMVDIQRPSIFFGCFSALLAHLITVTNRLSSSFPPIAIINVATTIIPVVFPFQPFVQMRGIYKEHVGFVSLLPPRRKVNHSTTSTATLNLFMGQGVCLSDLCFHIFRMFLAIKWVTLTLFHGFHALLRATSCQNFTARARNLKICSANHTGLHGAFMGIAASLRAVFPSGVQASHGKIFTAMQACEDHHEILHPFVGGSFVNFCWAGSDENCLCRWVISLSKPMYIITQIGVYSKRLGYDFINQRELGYDPLEEEALNAVQSAHQLTAFSRGQGMPPTTPSAPALVPESPFLGSGQQAGGGQPT